MHKRKRESKSDVNADINAAIADITSEPKVKEPRLIRQLRKSIAEFEEYKESVIREEVKHLIEQEYPQWRIYAPTLHTDVANSNNINDNNEDDEYSSDSDDDEDGEGDDDDDDDDSVTIPSQEFLPPGLRTDKTHDYEAYDNAKDYLNKVLQAVKKQWLYYYLKGEPLDSKQLAELSEFEDYPGFKGTGLYSKQVAEQFGDALGDFVYKVEFLYSNPREYFKTYHKIEAF